MSCELESGCCCCSFILQNEQFKKIGTKKIAYEISVIEAAQFMHLNLGSLSSALMFINSGNLYGNADANTYLSLCSFKATFGHILCLSKRLKLLTNKILHLHHEFPWSLSHPCQWCSQPNSDESIDAHQFHCHAVKSIKAFYEKIKKIV